MKIALHFFLLPPSTASQTATHTAQDDGAAPREFNEVNKKKVQIPAEQTPGGLSPDPPSVVDGGSSLPHRASINLPPAQLADDVIRRDPNAALAARRSFINIISGRRRSEGSAEMSSVMLLGMP